MAGNRTLTILKPDVVKAGNTGKVIDRIIEAGYAVKAMKLIQLTEREAGMFYEVHKERPFFGELVEFMTSGPIVPMILEKDNAVGSFRDFIGATDPAEADEGTIRKDFGTDKGQNAVHGSDSDENARRESRFFFSDLEEV
jgi:nucleoside-diphosphate kinase